LVNEIIAAKKGRYTCDVTEYGSVHATAKGLAIHKRRHHFSNICVDAAASVPVLQSDDVKSVESYSSTRSVQVV